MSKANLIIEEVNKVIIGKEKVIRKVWMTILSGGHVLLEDVPGVGKTTMALAFSKALGLSYRRIQFTPDVMPSDVVGFYYYNKESGKFEYRQGAVMTNLLLADEINRTSSRTQSALLEVMEEGQVTVDSVTRNIPEPSLRIRKMKTRWGVCNTKTHVITLNLELITKDINCLDYVIYHELSHLVEANHSKRFWLVVEENFKDYKKYRALTNDR